MHAPWRLVTGLAFVPWLAAAQAVPARDSLTVVPGAQFAAGGIKRFFFGTHYRHLWTTPIRVPVLDLARYAGGLTPLRRGGGMQTQSLRFKGADGREYAFRSLAKDPVGVLPPELRGTVAADILRDQISAAHPAGPLVVAPLLEAAGVLHATPVLVQLPDDPVLGEFRKDFAGVLGMIEERPVALGDEESSFAGARTIVGTAELFKELDDHPEVGVDAPAFLLARLTDVFLGDWDRHSDQWRWARVSRTGKADAWLPIPRDRDQAFVRLDGFLLAQARRTAPQLLDFGAGYGSISGATWNGRNLDRRFLTGLELRDWDSVAALLQSRLTDDAIARAVRRLPPEYLPQEGARLEAALKARRNRLPEVARAYYRHLAGVVDVFASDKADSAGVNRRDDGRTEVTVSHRGDVYFRRVFEPGQTREVRLLMQGGGDQVTVDGTGKGHPTIRVVGGGGDDRFTVRTGRGVKLYDDRGDNTAVGAGINTRPWHWRPDSLADDIRLLPPRDWGRRTILLARGAFGPDLGVVFGYDGHTDWYGFRRRPSATRLDYGIALSSGKSSGRLELGVTRYAENRRLYVELGGMASGIETLRWYGFGNETQETVTSSDARHYRVSQQELALGLRLGTRIGSRSRFSLGPVLRWSNTDPDTEDNRDRFIATDLPYGVGKFRVLGAGAELVLEGRDFPRFATRGGALSLKAEGYSGAWDATEAALRLDAQGSLALAPRGRWQPSLHLMAGGSVTSGAVPFFLAPTLGGTRTLRGYRPDRFAGERSVYGSVELRVPVTRLKLVVPGQQGIFGFNDVGKVFVSGMDSDRWHSTLGGGLWFSFLTRDNVLVIGAGQPTRGKEGGRVFVGFGFPW